MNQALERQSHKTSALRTLFWQCFLLMVGTRRHATKVLLRTRRLSALITIHVTDRLMKLLKLLVLSVAMLTAAQAMQQPSAHTKGTPTGKPTGPLKPGEYWWKPSSRRVVRSWCL